MKLEGGSWLEGTGGRKESEKPHLEADALRVSSIIAPPSTVHSSTWQCIGHGVDSPYCNPWKHLD